MANYGLQVLLDARSGLPDEKKAATTIATFASMPGIVVAILASALFVGPSEPFEKLAAIAIGGSFAAVAGIFTVVWFAHRLLGFRALVLLGDFLNGLLLGTFATRLANFATDSMWTVSLVPIGGILGVLIGRLAPPNPKPEASAE